mgnify:CR=1 FL=1
MYKEEQNNVELCTLWMGTRPTTCIRCQSGFTIQYMYMSNRNMGEQRTYCKRLRFVTSDL